MAWGPGPVAGLDVFTEDALPGNAAAASVLVGAGLVPAADASSFGQDSSIATWFWKLLSPNPNQTVLMMYSCTVLLCIL